MMDEDQVSILILLDVSAALSTADHELTYTGSLGARTNGMSCGAQSYVQLWALKHIGSGLRDHY